MFGRILDGETRRDIGFKLKDDFNLVEFVIEAKPVL